MDFGLPQKTILQLKSVFKNHPEITQVKIYGSRARGYYKRGSDIDLAFFSKSEEDLSSNISWELDDLPSPYIFDLVNYNTLNDSPLKEEIDKYGKVLYRKSAEIPSSLKQEKPLLKKQLFLQKLKNDEIKNLDTERSSEFKQTEIGEMPKDWEVFLFKNCTRKVTFNRIKQIQKNQYLKIGKFPIIDQGKSFVSGWTNDESNLINKELPIIVFGDHTRVFKYIDKPFALGADGTKLIKPNDDYNTKYFYYLMQNISIPNKGYNRHFKLLREIPLPRPSLTEQEKIAGILSQIQKAIEIQDKIIKTTKELKQSTMKQLFTYGVKGSDKKEMLLTGKLNMQNNLKWTTVSLENIAEIISGQSPKSEHYNKDNEGLPFYQGKTEFTEIYIGSPKSWTNKAIKIAEKNDILMSVRAPVGPVNIATQKICIGRGLTAIRSKKVNQLFLFYYLNSSENNIKGHGGTIFDSISREQIKSIKIPHPPLFEQKEIADILTKIDQKIQIHKKKKLRLKELFKTMLNQLMAGKIRVHKLDILHKFMVQ